MELLKDFNISEFKKNKPPGDNSITTKNKRIKKNTYKRKVC